MERDNSSARWPGCERHVCARGSRAGASSLCAREQGGGIMFVREGAGRGQVVFVREGAGRGQAPPLQYYAWRGGLIHAVNARLCTNVTRTWCSRCMQCDAWSECIRCITRIRCITHIRCITRISRESRYFGFLLRSKNATRRTKSERDDPLFYVGLEVSSPPCYTWR